MIGRALPLTENTGGVAGQMDLLASGLARRGHAVTVFAVNSPAASVPYEFCPIPIPDAFRTHRRLVLYLVPWSLSLLRLDEFDVVHAHGDDHFIRAQRPLVRTFHGASMAEARYSRRLRHRLYHLSLVPFERISERKATAVVTVSQSTQQYLTRRSQVIPNGYDPAIFLPGPQKSVEPSVLFVGDLETRKRGDLLIKAFLNVVRPALPTAQLWLVTSTSVTALGVRWFGRVSTPILAELYRRAWVFCLPSSYEGFGVPYVEAMASGTAVVATPNGGAEEVLGEVGRITSEDELGPELVRLLMDDQARSTMVARGLVRARDYVVSRVVEQYETLYKSLIPQPRSAA